MNRREVWITGIGTLTSLGLGLDATWEKLLAGEQGFEANDEDAARAVECFVRAKVQGFRPNRIIKNRKSLKLMTRPVKLGVAAATLAYQDAGLESEEVDPERIGVFVGAGQAFADRKELQYALEKSRGQDNQVDLVKFGDEGLDLIHPLWLLRGLSNNVLGFVSLDFNAQGINNNYANSGVSSAQAIAGAADAIAEGRADLAFAGGYDTAAVPECIVGYGRLGMLSTGYDADQGPHRPFDKSRSGFVPAEGACFMILEAAESARARGAKPIARVLGGTVMMDGFAVADPDPGGNALERAIQSTLQMAGRSADDVDAVFAHGASSRRYDLIEADVYKRLLGDRAAEVPVTADKAALGHTIAACGAISAGIAARAIQEGVVPPIASLEEVDPACEGLNYVSGEALKKELRHVLVCNAGAGGQASALLLAKVEESA